MRIHSLQTDPNKIGSNFEQALDSLPTICIGWLVFIAIQINIRTDQTSFSSNGFEFQMSRRSFQIQLNIGSKSMAIVGITHANILTGIDWPEIFNNQSIALLLKRWKISMKTQMLVKLKSIKRSCLTWKLLGSFSPSIRLHVIVQFRDVDVQ